MNSIRKVFVGRSGIRAGWRLLIFLAMSQAIVKLLYVAMERTFHYKEPEGWYAYDFIVEGVLSMVALLAAGDLMRRIERRSFRQYGLPLRGAFGKMFWRGMLWGLASSSVMLLLILALHGASVEGFALRGQALATSALAWGAAFILVGLVEEFSFRGYPLFTLCTGMGFWPSAVLLSVLFGAVHYFGKPMETWSDAVSIIFWGILWSLSLRRTGSLWFAIGFHAMSDYADMVLFAQPNTGNQGMPLHGHLLQVTYTGPDWLTGGVRGSEASLLEFAILAAMFVIFLRRYPKAKFPLNE
jgi:hypothetical protein